MRWARRNVHTCACWTLRPVNAMPPIQAPERSHVRVALLAWTRRCRVCGLTANFVASTPHSSSSKRGECRSRVLGAFCFAATMHRHSTHRQCLALPSAA